RDVAGLALSAPIEVSFTTASAPAPPPTTRTSGALNLTVAGLPSGGMANITITGPGGFNQTATGSKNLLDLAPGTYTIPGLNVLVSSAIYGSTPASQTVPVTASTTAATATVTYAKLPSGWASTTGMPTARTALAVGVVNGVLYAVGGGNGPGGGGALTTVES